MSEVTLKFNGDATSLKAASEDAKLALRQVSAEVALANAQLKAGTLSRQDYNKYMKELAKDAVPARAALANLSAQVLEASRSQQNLSSGIKLTSFQMMEFGRIAKDLATGQTAMLQRSSFTLANSMGILAAAFTPVGIAIMGTVAILGTLFAAFIAGSREQQAFNNALILTGNYAATTSGDLIDLTTKIGAATGNYSGAQEALTKLAASGKITSDQLLFAGEGVVNFAKMTGESVDKAAQEFVKLADDPAKGIIELDKSMHFLTASTIEQIDVLQQAGDKAGAATLALQTLADTSKTRAGQMVADAGTIERAWDAITKSISGSWQALKNIGNDSINVQLSQAEARLNTVSSMLDSIRKGENGGGGLDRLNALGSKLVGGADKDYLVGLQANLIAQVDALEKQKKATNDAAAAQGAANKAASDAAQIEHSLSQAILDGADKQTKYAAAVAATKAQFDQLRAAGVTTVSGMSLQAAETLRLTQLQKEYGDSGKSAATQQNALASAMKALDDLADKQSGSLGPTADAWAKYNIAVREANTLAEKAAIEGGNVADIIVKQNAATDAATATLNKNLAAAAKQADIIGNLNKAAADKAAWDSMTKSQQIVAKTVQDATDKWNKLDDAQKKLAGDLPAVQAAAEAAGQKIADAFNLEEILHGLDKTESPFEKIVNQISDVNDALAKTQKHLQDLKSIQGLGGVIDPDDLKRTETELAKLNTGLGNLQTKMVVGILGASADALRGIQSMSKQGSKAYNEMEIAVDALGIAQAIVAVLNQGNGDPYSAFVRMAAMVATVAPLVAQLGGAISGLGGGGAPNSSSAQVRQQTQGTGTVLGDAKAQSDSIAKSLDITAKATTALVGINRGMLNALQSLQQALGSAGTQLAQGAGNATFPGLTSGNAFNNLISSADVLGGDPITKALGNLLFGGSQKVIDQGIVIAGGTLQNMLDNIVIGAYQTIHKSGGLFSSGKTFDNTVDLSDTLGKQFQLIIGSLVDTVKQAATALGVPLDDIQAKINAFKIAETHISLQGLSAADQQKALEAVFSQIFDNLAGSVVPYISKFQKVGEGLGETLVRVATEVQTMQQAVKYLGLTVDETDPEKFAEISDGLIGMFASVDDFITAMQGFTNAFAPDSYKFKVASDALNSAFDQIGLTLPSTRQGLFQLVQTLDATTESGRKQIATILQLSSVADQYYSMIDAKQKALTDYQNEVAGINVSTGHVAPIIDQLRQIRQWSIDESAKLNSLAQSAGLAGAAESDLARVQEEAAQRAAEAIATLKQSTLDLAAKLGYVDTLDTLNAKIAALQSASAGAAVGIGNAASSISAASDALNLEIGDLSPYSDQKKLALALQGLRAGSVTADQVLQIGRRLYSSGNDYNQLFEQVLGITKTQRGTPGGGTSGGGQASNNANLAELIAQRDKLQAIQDKQNAQQLAQNIADLAQAQKETVQQVADDLGINLADVAKTLGVSQDSIADYIKALQKEDLAGTYVDASGHIVNAVTDSANAVVYALYDIASKTLPAGATLTPSPVVIPTPPPSTSPGTGSGVGASSGGKMPPSSGVLPSNSQQAEAVITLLASIAGSSNATAEASGKTHRALADAAKERLASNPRTRTK